MDKSQVKRMDIDKITMLQITKTKLWIRDARPAKFWPKSYGLWIKAKTMDLGAIYSDDQLGFAEKLWITREYGLGGIWIRGEVNTRCDTTRTVLVQIIIAYHPVNS